MGGLLADGRTAERMGTLALRTHMRRREADDLGRDAVHVWQAALDGRRPAAVRLGAWLSADERARADAFRSADDQRRFIVGRGTLRAILGHYLSLPPEAVRFAYGPQGKPRLAHASAQAALRFNVSHAHELVLVAVACAREVGVDVEYLRPIPEADRIAERMFSPEERETLRRLPASERLPAFFTTWTLKEAYLKALGDGLLSNRAHPSRLVGWWSCAFSPRPGYQAALAAEGQKGQWWLGTWTWGTQPPVVQR